VFVNLSRVGIVAAVAASALLVPTAALADTMPQYNSISGEGTFSGPGVVLFGVDFHAANTGPSGSAATGEFKGSQSGYAVQGPIGCLEVVKKHAGFIFTADKSSTPDFLAGSSYLVSVYDDSPGGTGQIGIKPIQPGSDLRSCEAGDTPLTTSDGHFTVNQTTTSAASTSTTRKELRK